MDNTIPGFGINIQGNSFIHPCNFIYCFLLMALQKKTKKWQLLSKALHTKLIREEIIMIKYWLLIINQILFLSLFRIQICREVKVGVFNMRQAHFWLRQATSSCYMPNILQSNWFPLLTILQNVTNFNNPGTE